MRLKSYAKINLYLHVLYRRKDGFHELDTLFERVSLCDRMRFLPKKEGIKVHCKNVKLPEGPGNLAYRAAELLQKATGVKKGVKIEIDKEIPVSAGLGGGSSNAATTLLALCKLWKIRLSKKKLLKLAGILGSDVPFFILNSSWAHASGRGEILKPIRAPKLKLWHCIIKPSFGISTQEAYGAFTASTLTPPKPNVKMLLHSIKKGHFQALGKFLTNSLEGSLNKRVRTILDLKEQLLAQGATFALMSGSGSAVFGIFLNEKKAKKAARYFQKKHRRWKIFTDSTA